MQPSKFSLADTLNLLACLGFGFVCFLGFHFKTLGDTEQSIVQASVIALALFLPAYLARRMKIISKNFRTGLVMEILFLLLFLAVAVFAIGPFSHYCNVSLDKATIQAETQANVDSAKAMFDDYEKYVTRRIALYENDLESAAFNQGLDPNAYADFGFVDQVADSTQIQTMLTVMDSKLYPTTYDTTKSTATNWLDASASTIAGWKPIGMVHVVQDMEANANQWMNELAGYSAWRAQNEQGAQDWTYTLAFGDLRQRFTAPDGQDPLAPVFALGLSLLMVLSYLVSKRHSKHPGFKQLFGKKAKGINEL